MNYWHKHKEFKKGAYDIVVSYSPEMEGLDGFFDDTEYNIKEMTNKIDRGDAVWFMVEVKALLNGIELGRDVVGGFYYEDKYEDEVIDEGLDGYLEDMVEEAINEANNNVAVIVKTMGQQGAASV